MTLFVSTLAFFLFLLLGKVLLFINEAFYILVLLYVLYLFLLKFFIKKGNCSAIQVYDYFYVGFFVAQYQDESEDDTDEDKKGAT